MKMKATVSLFLFLMTNLFLVGPAFSEDEGVSYVIVANKSVPMVSISMKMLKRIYLKDITTWEGGGNISPVDLDEENSLRTSFYKKILGKGVDEMRSYWINQKLTNNISAPLALKNSQNVRTYVSQNSGAIGYIKQNEVDPSVKVLAIEP
jgi:ABC-type phosphate transport system substrate-binding protein